MLSLGSYAYYGNSALQLVRLHLLVAVVHVVLVVLQDAVEGLGDLQPVEEAREGLLDDAEVLVDDGGDKEQERENADCYFHFGSVFCF